MAAFFDLPALSAQKGPKGETGKPVLITLVPSQVPGARRLTAAFLGLALLALGGCQSSNLGLDTEPAQQAPQLTANPNGEVLGRGQVRVALLVPRSAPGNAATVALEIRNGADLAMREVGQDIIQLVIKDTAGQAANAQAAATEAVSEDASAVLGPVFSANVSAASAITQPSGRTMFAYSTDSTVARRGVYLLSFTPQEDTARAIRFAMAQGKRAILAFLPNSTEGTLRESVLRQVAGAGGASVFVIKYDRTGPSIEEAIRQAGASLQAVDSIYIAEGNEIPNVIMQGFQRQGINAVSKQLIGSGTWETTKVSEPYLEGAIYPGRDLTNFAAFSARYEAAFGAKPSFWAALGYDSVTLSAELVRQLGPQRAFATESVENLRGFAGVNGIFRFRQDGTAERGLAMYQVSSGVGQVIEPAPRSFTRTGF
jgi:ABC-type branched-subunit amino acid transport system substrate-binding protein